MTNVTSWQGQLQYMLVRAVNDSLLLVLFVDTFLHYFTSPPPLHKINMLTLPRTSWFSFQAFTVIAKWLRYSVFRIVFKNKNWLGGGRLTRGWLPARLADRSKGAYEKKEKQQQKKKRNLAEFGRWLMLICCLGSVECLSSSAHSQLAASS